MKNKSAILSAVILAAISTQPARAIVLSTNTNFTTGLFNTADGYDANASLDGAPTNAPSSEQWQTTDPFNGSTGSTSVMNFNPGWTFGVSGSGNQSVRFGGYDLTGGVIPGITNPVLYREFSPVSGSSLVLQSVTWTTDFGIQSGYPFLGATNYQDTFGFDLQDSLGNSLAQFLFNPSTATSQDLRLEWYRNGALQATNSFEIQYDALYKMTATLYGSQFDLSVAGYNVQTNGLGVVTNYAIVTNVSIITGGLLSGAFTAGDFATAAIDWQLASGDANDPGGQALLLNNMSVTSVSEVIPEPGTWAGGIALLGIAGLILWRRKSAAAIGA